MKRSPPLRLAAVLSAGLFVAPVTCNSILTKSAPVDTDQQPFEYVNVVGTNIPQRVVKGQQPLTPSPVTTVSAERFIEAMEKAQGRVNTRGP